MTGKLYSVQGAATLLGVHPQTVYRMIRDGELPKLRVRSSVRIEAEAIETFLRKAGAAK